MRKETSQGKQMFPREREILTTVLFANTVLLWDPGRLSVCRPPPPKRPLLTRLCLSTRGRPPLQTSLRRSCLFFVLFVPRTPCADSEIALPSVSDTVRAVVCRVLLALCRGGHQQHLVHLQYAVDPKGDENTQTARE